MSEVPGPTEANIGFSTGRSLVVDPVSTSATSSPDFHPVPSSSSSVAAAERTVREFLDLSRGHIQDAAHTIRPLALVSIGRAANRLQRAGEQAVRAHQDRQRVVFDYGDVSDENLDRGDYIKYMNSQIDRHKRQLRKARLRQERRHGGRNAFVHSQVIDSQFLNMQYGDGQREHKPPQVLARSTRGTDIFWKLMRAKDAVSKNLPTIDPGSLQQQVRVFSRTAKVNMELAAQVLPSLATVVPSLPSRQSVIRTVASQSLDLGQQAMSRLHTRHNEPAPVVSPPPQPSETRIVDFARITIAPSVFPAGIGHGGDIFTEL